MVDISCTMVVGGSGSYVAFGGVGGGWRLSMGDIMQVPKVLGRVCR